MSQPNQAGQGNIGAYGALVGYNLSVSLSFDDVVQISSMPQVSASTTTAVNAPVAKG